MCVCLFVCVYTIKITTIIIIIIKITSVYDIQIIIIIVVLKGTLCSMCERNRERDRQTRGGKRGRKIAFATAAQWRLVVVAILCAVNS